MPRDHQESIESRRSWVVAIASTMIVFVGWGTIYIIVVNLKPIAADLGVARSVPSLAYSLAYFGTGLGGIAAAWWADRAGAMAPALLGSVALGLGCILAGMGAEWQLYLGHGLLIGLLGNAGIFAPLMANVSRWFDLRRGTALALVASGQQIAGAIWPPLFRYLSDAVGWRGTFFWYGIFALVTMTPLCFFLRGKPPAPTPAATAQDPRPGAVLDLPPNLVQALICAAIVCCCIAMSMPMSHLVAFCSDLGYLPARGAEMLSLLLGSAFLSRMFWGRLSDRVGGLMTVLIGSFCQAVFLSFYLFVDGLVGLYLVSAAFGLGFGGIVPSYVLAIRQLFPAADAGWRIATVVLFGLLGMALGGWLGGFIYDWAAYYKPAFAAGVAFNVLNLLLIGSLVRRQGGGPMRASLASAT